MAKKRKRKSSKKKENLLFFYLTLWSFAFMLFYPPYFRGLFFKVEQQWTLLLAALVFLLCCLWKISRDDFSFLSDPLDYAAAGLLLAYVISCFMAADLRLAVAEVVKMSLYFIVFWVAGQIAVKEKVPSTVLSVIYLSGVGVALAGFLTAVGVVHIKDGFVGNRIFSTLQYPNALAIYLAAVVTLGFYLWLSSSKFLRLFIAPGNFLLMLIFFSTNSRGGFLVFPLMLLFYFIGLPRTQKLPWAAHALTVSVLGLFVSGGIIPAAVAGKMAKAWVWMLAGLAASVLAQWLGSLIHETIKKQKGFLFGTIAGKKIFVGAAVMAAVILLGGVMWLGQPAAEGSKAVSAFLPEHIAARISDISLKTHSAQTRVYWTLEAFDLVKNSPFIGMGGGAWEAAYRKFQDYYYTTTQVHNHFLQLWAEVGTLGLLFFITVWVMFIITAVKNYRAATTEERILNLSLLISAVGLGLHSFIDFDLALSAVAMVLWVNFGLVRGISKKRSEGYTSLPGDRKLAVKRKFIIITAVLTLFFVLLPGSLLIAGDYAKRAVVFAREGKLDKAELNFVKASKFDPFSGDYRANLASIKMARGDMEAAVKYIKQAIDRCPYDMGYYSMLAKIEQQRGNWEEALPAALKAKEAAPWVLASYEVLSDVYVSAGLDYLKKNKPQEAVSYLAECAKIPDMLNEQVEGLPERIRQLWRTEKEFTNLTAPIKLNAGISQCLLSNFEISKSYLEQALKDQRTEQRAHLWLAVMAKKNGMQSEAEQHLKAVKEKHLLDDFDTLSNLPLIKEQ